MKKILGLILCSCLFISGCGVARGITAMTNRDKLDRLEIGMTKEEVKELMGKPYKREAYQEVEYWLYYTEWQPDGYTTDDEFTPVAFIDGKVDGWGRNYYQDRKKKIEADIKIRQE